MNYFEVALIDNNNLTDNRGKTNTVPGRFTTFMTIIDVIIYFRNSIL